VQPRFGQAEQRIDSAALVVGGSAAITAVGASRLGLRVGLMAMVGQDDLGQLMTVRLAEAGVDLQHIGADGSVPTGVTVILNDAEDRAIFTAPGAIASLSPMDLDALPDRPARHVHASSYYLMSKEFQAALPDTFERFRGADVTTSLDTNWDPEQRWELSSLLDHTNVFLPNESEIAALAGSTILDRAVEVVSEHGCDVVVKRGKLGAVAHVGTRTFRVSRTPPTEFVDAVGAGDTFNAGYLAGTLLGRDPGKCLAMAVIAGSLSTAAAGGTAGQPEMEDVESWLSSILVIEGEGELP
jgi:sugar/nucleoside kinase (ribokinase family)